MKRENKQKKAQIIKFSLIFFLLAVLTLVGRATLARTFNPHDILTDWELFKAKDLSKTAIANFLTRENSALAGYQETINGEIKSTAQMIYEVSENTGVSSKFLLATLEKEKSLITKTTATQKELDWATGYSCFNNYCNPKYQGFFNQIESSAITQKIYQQKAGTFSFQVGKTTKTYDNYPVTPVNQATANLYIYTPYVGNAPDLDITSKVGGNYLFWIIWHRYFTDKKYPDGLVLTDNTDFWLIENEQKRKFISKEIFLADYSESDAILVSPEKLAAYPDGPIIYFADKTLVRQDSTGQAFYLLGKEKRPILDEAVLANLTDFKLAVSTMAEIPAVAAEKLSGYQTGSPIMTSAIHPGGKLYKDEAGLIFLVKDNLKLPVDQVVWQINYKSETLPIATAEYLNQFPTGSPVKIKSGTFIKNQKNIYYLISGGERMKIEVPEIAKKYFGERVFQNALTVSDDLLFLHEGGLNIDYLDDTLQDAQVTTPTPAAATESYAAEFLEMSPASLTAFANETLSVSFKFKNQGTATWQPGSVWLEIEGSDSRYNFSETQAASSQTATFTFNLQAPAGIGLTQKNFTLYYLKSGQKEKIMSLGKFILVKEGDNAIIVSHNLPIALKNTWKPINITVKIKNQSTVTWLSRKTALEIYDSAGKASPFYDPNDWIRTTVAAVPINKKEIKSGEIGEFKFTIKPTGLKRGTYTLKFKLNLLDKKKEIFLNGNESWERQIRVD